jgi:hypothetical protein
MTPPADSLQPESKPPSRRALLAGALGGIGALAASAIGRASPVRGADGQAVVVGGEYAAGSATGFTTTTSNALYGTSGSGTGVSGSSSSYIGVNGSSTSHIGVYGSSSSYYGVRGDSNASGWPANLGWAYGNSTGVQGYSGSGSPPTAKAKTGVYGYAAQDASSQGVWGHSPAGNGVVGSTTSGYAGYFSGKVYSTQFYELSEISAPLAPAANRARLFVRDNGAGKTQLCVRFNTGAIQVLASQP